MSSSYLKFFHVPVERFMVINGPGFKDCRNVFSLLADDVPVEEVPTLTFTLYLGNGENEDQKFSLGSMSSCFQRKLKLTSTNQHFGDGFYYITTLEGHEMIGFHNMRSRTGWLEVKRG